MPVYHFRIRKADHENDLHVHISFSHKSKRMLLGRYRLPTLEPIFSKQRELNKREMKALQEWLARPEQVQKLNNCLEDTIFNMHKVIKSIPSFGKVMVKNGETYIDIRIPVSRRI